MSAFGRNWAVLLASIVGSFAFSCPSARILNAQASVQRKANPEGETRGIRVLIEDVSYDGAAIQIECRVKNGSESSLRFAKWIAEKSIEESIPLWRVDSNTVYRFSSGVRIISEYFKHDYITLAPG